MTSLSLFKHALAALGLAALAACGGGGGSTDPAAAPAGGGGGAATVLSLSAAGTSARSASLAWTPVPGASGYTLQRKAAGTGWTDVATLGTADHSYVDDGLTQGTTYTYRVVARGTDAAPAEQAATTTTDEPLVTAAATPLDGATDSASIGTGGGSVASADGSARLALPAGAFSAPATVTLQRASNPLPSALGKGLRVRLPALPAQPMTLTVRYDAAEDAQADGMGVALQRPDGSWLALPVTALDRTARTLTVPLSPALLARPVAGALAAAASAEVEFTVVRYLNLYLSPREASVRTGSSLVLVPYAHAEVQPCWVQPEVGCLPGLVLEKREIPFDNVKPGYTRKWYVFAEEGGTPALGTVTPRAGAGAVYRAPLQAPTPNPVVVSFVSRHDKTGRTVTLSSSVLVKEPVWTMILSGVLDGAADIGFAYSAEAVWTRVAGDAEVYRANGTQSVNVINIICVVSASPSTVPLPPGALTIDRSVQPARYRLDVGSLWQTTVSGVCPDGAGSTQARVPGQLVVEGTLSADGTRIDGSVEQNHVFWTWSLTDQL